MGHVQKRAEGRWRPRYRDPEGNERSRTFATRSDAKAYLREQESDLARGEWVRELSDAGLAAPTIKRALLVLRAVLATAIDASGLKSNPAVGVSPPRYQRREMLFLSPTQVDDLANAVGEHRPLSYTGARIGEVRALRRDNVDLLRRRIRISEAVTAGGNRTVGPTKTHQARTAPIPAFLVEVLAEHLRHPHERVVPGTRGGQLHYRAWLQNVFRPAVRATPSLPDGLRVHDLRHAAA